MTIVKATVNSESGIHARPASELVNFAKTFESKIYIASEVKKAAATSIIMILTLGAKKGTVLEVSADGPDEAVAAQKIAEFIEAIID